jgi:hypothetical protein
VASIVFSRQGGGELLASGTVLFPEGQNVICTLKDGAEELLFEIIVERQQEGALPVPIQLSFNTVSATSAQFIFKGAYGAVGAMFKLPIAAR